MSRDGDAVQVFGNGAPSPDIPGLPEGIERDGMGDGEDDASSVPPSFLLPPSPLPSMSSRLSIERRDPDGGGLVLQREGRKLRIRTDRLSVRID
jgi:hypothetical protein